MLSIFATLLTDQKYLQSCHLFKHTHDDVLMHTRYSLRARSTFTLLIFNFFRMVHAIENEQSNYANTACI